MCGERGTSDTRYHWSLHHPTWGNRDMKLNTRPEQKDIRDAAHVAVISGECYSDIAPRSFVRLIAGKIIHEVDPTQSHGVIAPFSVGMCPAGSLQWVIVFPDLIGETTHHWEWEKGFPRNPTPNEPHPEGPGSKGCCNPAPDNSLSPLAQLVFTLSEAAARSHMESLPPMPTPSTKEEDDDWCCADDPDDVVDDDPDAWCSIC